MGQFLQRLLHAHAQYPHLPPDPSEIHRNTDESRGPSMPDSTPAALGLNSIKQIGAKSTKSPADSSDAVPSEVPSEGFDMSQKRHQQTASPQPDGQQLVLPQVDAISKSKSTSSGTRRVYKVVRVVPSNFYSLSKQAHQTNVNPPSSPREGEQKQQQPLSPQQQPHQQHPQSPRPPPPPPQQQQQQQQPRKIATKSKSNKPANN